MSFWRISCLACFNDAYIMFASNDISGDPYSTNQRIDYLDCLALSDPFFTSSVINCCLYGGLTTDLAQSVRGIFVTLWFELLFISTNGFNLHFGHETSFAYIVQFQISCS